MLKKSTSVTNIPKLHNNQKNHNTLNWSTFVQNNSQHAQEKTHTKSNDFFITNPDTSTVLSQSSNSPRNTLPLNIEEAATRNLREYIKQPSMTKSLRHALKYDNIYQNT
jgi:hypothetical protein